MQLREIQLDTNFEEEQHHADVSEDLELMAVGDIAGGERRDDEADRQVAKDRRQTGAPRQPAGDGGDEQDETDFEDIRSTPLNASGVRVETDLR